MGNVLSPGTFDACHRVLGTPELLDAILLGLPQRDLLVAAQRVSQAWRAHITTSPLLMRRLFLHYYDPRAQDAPLQHREHSSLLLDYFPELIVHDLPTKETSLARPSPRIRALDPHLEKAFAARLNRPEASWQLMHVAMQPVRRIAKFEVRRYGPPSFAVSSARFLELEDFPHGLRMGDLHCEALMRLRPECNWNPPIPLAEQLVLRAKGVSLSCRPVDLLGLFLFFRSVEEHGWQSEAPALDLGDEALATLGHVHAVLIIDKDSVEGSHFDRALEGLPGRQGRVVMPRIDLETARRGFP
ncbi:hypothetical protein Micbo1qcDRAFT_215835 [Microdochium bolleyi]|uniref:F-box domain-containing protein n=1 Tax=Microdochium bolleyi TaxID=196109 RepID=A0A136IRK2_9PEZI|nr:hypothetical protein Micbo1qcDRAFT_215835 [Microdochium bolleyi]